MPANGHRDDPVAREVRPLEQVAKVGAGAETPAILAGGLWLVFAVVVTVILGLTLIVSRLAS